MSNAPLSVEQAILQAKAHADNEELEHARQLYQAVLNKYPMNNDAREGLNALKPQHTGLSQTQVNALTDLYSQGRFQEALAQGTALEKQHPNVLFIPILLGAAYVGLGDNEKAAACYHRALVLKPDDAEVHYNLGAVFNKLGKYENAVASYSKALTLKYDTPDIHNNLGIALNNLGTTLNDLGEHEEAITKYQSAIEVSPNNIEAYNNLGIALKNLGKNQDAITTYHKALKIDAENPDVHYNLGNALYNLNKNSEAIISYKKSLELRPDNVKVYNNLGHALSDIGNRQEAIANYQNTIRLDENHISARGALLYELGLICDWDEIKKITPGKLELLEFGLTAKEVVSPFSLLGRTDDAKFQQRTSEAYASVNDKPNPALGPILSKSRTDKIKIGYFSSDFRNHPVMHLMIEFYKKHDRSKFEIHAFSFGPDRKDDIRSRLIKNVDRFHDVRLKKDIEIAALSRSLGIDIAVDLNGYTAHCRTGIFTYRAAPIQAHYLGYPGTMGAPYFDYIVADPIMIPPEHQKFYTEKVAYLPNSYQVNNSTQEISDKTITRSDANLPEDAFVFCCFNNTYKISPDDFDVWMRLLKRINGSVLWLFKANQTAEKNLRKEALRRGIAPDRLIFAGRMPLPEHLARHRLADLFLDTFNYNAHATGSGALWAGLPVLTKMGESFPSRAGASLLNAVGLPELITTTAQEYEDIALRLATHPQELGALRKKLSHNLKTTSLFDETLFAKHIEAAYSQMLTRLDDGLEPDHIYVEH